MSQGPCGCEKAFLDSDNVLFLDPGLNTWLSYYVKNSLIRILIIRVHFYYVSTKSSLTLSHP